jgi:hypothetical protein
MVNKWVDHVKQYANDHNISYRDALKVAGETYTADIMVGGARPPYKVIKAIYGKNRKKFNVNKVHNPSKHLLKVFGGIEPPKKEKKAKPKKERKAKPKKTTEIIKEVVEIPKEIIEVPKEIIELPKEIIELPKKNNEDIKYDTFNWDGGTYTYDHIFEKMEGNPYLYIAHDIGINPIKEILERIGQHYNNDRKGVKELRERGARLLEKLNRLNKVNLDAIKLLHQNTREVAPEIAKYMNFGNILNTGYAGVNKEYQQARDAYNKELKKKFNKAEKIIKEHLSKKKKEIAPKIEKTTKEKVTDAKIKRIRDSSILQRVYATLKYINNISHKEAVQYVKNNKNTPEIQALFNNEANEYDKLMRGRT